MSPIDISDYLVLLECAPGRIDWKSGAGGGTRAPVYQYT
jgi:hypothetical protein